jgi:hypothetical protein
MLNQSSADRFSLQVFVLPKRVHQVSSFHNL